MSSAPHAKPLLVDTDRRSDREKRTSEGAAAEPKAPEGGKADTDAGESKSWADYIFTEAFLEEVMGGLIFAGFTAFLCAFIPLIREQKEKFSSYNFPDGQRFNQYLEYRFTDWFLTVSGAPIIVLVVLSVGLIVCGAILYAILVGGTPARALFKIFVWAAAASADESSVGGRFLGILVTVAGLVILSLLLGIVAEAFASWMTAIKTGQKDIIEGGHVVILGFTECTRCLLEELALARESDGGSTFVLLAEGDKTEVENEILSTSIDLKNSRLIVRSGRPFVIRDLRKVAVSTASQVVLLADTTVSREEADAKSIRTLLAMKCQGWPLDGHIVVQCCSTPNAELLKSIYQGKVEVVVVGDIVAKLMVQTAKQPGLAGVFGMMLGFEGDEFYSEEWPEVVGLTFRECVFRFPDACSLGVFTEEGECKLNPGWDYVIQEGDKIIVLAEDNDTYKAEDAPYFDYKNFQAPVAKRSISPRNSITRNSSPEGSTNKVLVVGWNDKMATLLSKMDSTTEAQTEVEVYSPRPLDARSEEIDDIQQRLGKFKNLKIQQLEVDKSNFTSRMELENLNHFQHDSIYILADVELEGRTGADEKTVAVLTQLQHIRSGIGAKKQLFNRATTSTSMFDPVVEMCEDSTKEHLTICGLTNLIHSVSLVAQALAAVTEEPKVNAIYGDLMSNTTNEFDITKFEEFLPAGEKVPDKISFGEATYRISLAADAILVAWSQGETDDGGVQWVMNPKDKITPRRWTERDRVVVIRRLPELDTVSNPPSAPSRSGSPPVP